MARETKLFESSSVIQYEVPRSWVRYDGQAVSAALVEAKAAILALRGIPYQRAWVERLQQLELKREIAGTSRIEGAEFTERELDQALKETPSQLQTRSQRQAHAAVQTYRWIGRLRQDRPLDADLVREIRRRIVMGADDDHCPPGRLRGRDENVNFGTPRHRGAEGGDECRLAFERFTQAVQTEYRGHDSLIQALAAHCHLAAIHPFLDGNGRTARAVEALLLQRAGLRDTCFIAMSNYYYDEKPGYLEALSSTRASGHDLTAFLLFGLRGIARQSRRLLAEIQHEISRALFRNMMYDLFNRLRTPRKRVLAERQLGILKLLLERESMALEEILDRIAPSYRTLRNPRKAAVRDLQDLLRLRALSSRKLEGGTLQIDIRLEWPTEITETEFFRHLKMLPTAKSPTFLG